MEEWKPVPGYTELYEVSNLGRIRSLDRVVIDKNGKQRLHKGVILTLTSGYSHEPYLVAELYKDGERKNKRVDWLVADAFLDPPDREQGRFKVSHKDGDPDNNSVENLYWEEIYHFPKGRTAYYVEKEKRKQEKGY